VSRRAAIIPFDRRATSQFESNLDFFRRRAIVCRGFAMLQGEFMTRKRMGALALCAAVLIPAAARAQQAPRKTTVLKAARLFDGKSNALVTPGVIVVTDGKITAVGANATVPAGAEVIDLGDATLLPDSSTRIPMSP
jgi:hypothetical protein